MNTQNYVVNIRVGLANPARVNISQGDTGRTLAFSLYDGLSPFTPPTGSTVTIVGRKPSKLGFSEACTVSGNVATVTTTLAMTQEAGKFPVELRIEANGESIGTANFTMYIEPSPHPDGTTDGTHATVDNLQTQIGNLANLATTAKTNLVSAINEAAQSGGVVIDDTLTQTGQAADAKKTGDEIGTIKADLSQDASQIETLVSKDALLNDFLVNSNIPSGWEQGHIKTSDGTDGLPSAILFSHCIRTKTFINTESFKYIFSKGDAVTNNLGIYVFQYSEEGTYESANSYLNVRGLFFISFADNKKYRLEIFDPLSTISVTTNALKDFSFYSTENNLILKQNAFAKFTEITEITDWVIGKRLPNTGNVIDVNNPVNQSATNSWKYCVIQCNVGDTFLLFVKGMADTRAYYITDSNYTIIERAEVNAVLDGRKITIPTDGAYLVVNNYGDYASGIVGKGLPIGDIERIHNNNNANFYGYISDGNSISLWEQGHIKSYDGTNGQSDAITFPLRIRTKGYIDESIDEIRVLNNGWSHIVAKYNLDGSYVGLEDENEFPYKFNHELYKYRVMLAKGYPYTNDTVPADYNNLVFCRFPIKTVNDYSRLVNYGNTNMMSGVYRATGNAYNLFSSTTTSQDVYDLYDALVNANPNYITKSDLGTAYGTTHLYAYTFKAKYVTKPQKKKPKVIIVSGQHGNEKTSIFGLYYMMRDMTNNWASDSILSYLRMNVDFIIVPIVNRYGFDNNQYKNENGVNINRNYNYNFTPGDDPTSEAYSGESALSETESEMITNLVLDNPDAFFVIDWHINGSASELRNLSWHSYSANVAKDPYLSGLIECSETFLSNETVRIGEEYSLDFGSNICGYYGDENAGKSTLKDWANSIGYMSMTFETSDIIPGKQLYSEETQKLNSEQMINWLEIVFSIFSTY